MTKLKATPDYLRASATSVGIGVDREAGRINGMVVAQEGPFKSEWRGEFDLPALKKINALMNKERKGLKSRLSHPTLSSDGIGKFLGRVINPRMDSVRVMRNGLPVLLHAVRGDLVLDQTALEEPIGGGKPIGVYVMDLAESDPDALSSSLVLKADEETRLDPKTKAPMRGTDGKPLPPLWRPTMLHASDIVDTGDAVDGLLSAQLSAEGLPDEYVRRACELLDGAFPDATPEVIRARLAAWGERYLSYRFGDVTEEAAPPVESAPGLSVAVAKAKVLIAEG